MTTLCTRYPLLSSARSSPGKSTVQRGPVSRAWDRRGLPEAGVNALMQAAQGKSIMEKQPNLRRSAPASSKAAASVRSGRIKLSGSEQTSVERSEGTHRRSRRGCDAALALHTRLRTEGMQFRVLPGTPREGGKGKTKPGPERRGARRVDGIADSPPRSLRD